MLEISVFGGVLRGEFAPRTRFIHCISYWNDSVIAVCMSINLETAKVVAIVQYSVQFDKRFGKTVHE